jgi:hypothetical protein
MLRISPPLAGLSDEEFDRIYRIYMISRNKHPENPVNPVKVGFAV